MHCCVLSNSGLSNATSKRPKFVEKRGNYSLPKLEFVTDKTPSPTKSVSSSGKHFIPPNPYLSELVAHYLPSRSLRSSNTSGQTTIYGITGNVFLRAFSAFAPSTWSHSPYRHTINLPTLTEILYIPVWFFVYCSHPLPAPHICFTISGAL